ncbi:MAG: thiamine diphosphokinase [Chloroflexi bacterium]|nr:thiamine diphosphokinase [Chloroflexota bacterium]
MSRAIIFANGELPNPESARALLRPDDFLIAADGGTMHILNLGLVPNIVIGDMDSMQESVLLRLGNSNVEMRRYPADKNETDLELALGYAIESGYREIIIVAALGGRLDQTLANISLLADLRPFDVARGRPSTFNLRLDDGVEEIFFCRSQVQVRGRSGDIVSLIPWGREATGVVTENLKWPLSNETLYPHKTRGVSNEMLGEEASIKIDSGLLLIIHRRQS